MGLLEGFLFLCLLGLAAFFWAAWIEPRAIQINRYEVTFSKPLGEPLTALHLSDIHFARPQSHVNRFFDRLAMQNVDLVLMTGDIIDCPEGIPVCIENLKKLKSSKGIFAVYGNHDYYNYHWRDVFQHNLKTLGHPKHRQQHNALHRALKEAGIRVLRNESVPLEAGGGALWIHGLDDPTTGQEDIPQITRGLDPGKINILLTHSVNVLARIEAGKIDLCLAGHSHGGQIRFPLIGPVVTHTTIGKSFVSGLRSFKGTVCSISRGVGASRYFPLRFLCPPEAILLTLRGHSR